MLGGDERELLEIGEETDVLEAAVVVADNGYHSEENVRTVLEEEIDASACRIIDFAREDPSFYRDGRAAPEAGGSEEDAMPAPRTILPGC